METSGNMVEAEIDMESAREIIEREKAEHDIKQLLSIKRIRSDNDTNIRKIKYRAIIELAYNLDNKYHELLLACYYANRTALAFQGNCEPDIQNDTAETAFSTELIDHDDYWIRESLVILKENVGNFLGGEYREELESLIESFDNNE